ncbi:LCP family protein [Nocardioides montaniterrae]
MSQADDRPRSGGARRATRSVRRSRAERRELRRGSASVAGRRALRPGDPAPTRSADVPRGGARRAAVRRRRADTLGKTLGITFLGAVVPGSGYLYAGRKALGWLVLGGWLAVIGALFWRYGTDWHRALDLVFNPRALKIAAAVVSVLLLIWVGVVWTSYRMVRPRRRTQRQTVLGNIAVVVICLVVAAPVLRAAQYALATAGLVTKVFDNNRTTTAPNLDAHDPWAHKDRVNLLLLGGDGDIGREGVRTDSMILLSIDTKTGKMVTFSLPRNLAGAQFPADSPLHALYPNGFTDGDPADGNYMLNAVYRDVPMYHPGVLGKSSNEGADAIKQAISGTLGIPVDYYLLVNLSGFREIVNAIGGVTVNVNEPIAIQGDTSDHIPPIGYIAPGPNEHLDGYHALWFARGRWGADDYQRMDRQRCMINAIIDAANPGNLLIRYLDLIKAGKQIVLTDIPKELGPAFVDLALKVKDGKAKSVVFKTSASFNSADPDFDYIHATVQAALHPAKKHHPSANPPEDPVDVCAYHPTGRTVADAEAYDAQFK